MDALKLKPATSADLEAREWFVRLLDKDVDAADLLVWERWLDADPANREAYERAMETCQSRKAWLAEAPLP